MMVELEWQQILQAQLLHPIVHPLCRAVQEYGGNKAALLKDKIASLQSQSQLLDAMEETLLRLPPMLSRMQQNIPEEQNLKLSNFFSLPLRGILRSYQPFETTTRARSPVLQSAIWKTVERASRVLQVLLEQWFRPGQMLYVDTKVRTKELQSFLYVLMEALPEDSRVEEVFERRSSLDKGEACIESTLRTVQSLVSILKSSVPWPAVVRLLSIATALIEPSRSMPGAPEGVVPATTQAAAANVILQLLLLRDGSSRDVVEQMRTVFPAIYAGLFRRIVSSLPQHEEALTTTCIACLAQLLDVTLRCSHETPLSVRSTVLDTEQWVTLAEQATSAEAATEDEPDVFLASVSVNDREFFAQVRIRLPQNLVELVGKLHVANNAKIRHATVRLLQSVAKADDRIWGEGSKVPLTVLEAIIVLSQDADEETRGEALSSLNVYTTEHVTSRDIKGWIHERIVALLQKLIDVAPAEGELDHTLKILQGYLSVNVKPIHRRDFQAGFRSEQVSTLLRKSFGALWDVDFGSRTMIVAGDTCPSRRHLRFIHRSATADRLESVVQSFGSALGEKKVALLIDASISNMYKSAADRVERGVSLAGESQIQWLHTWIGMLHMVSGLFRGCAGRSQRLFVKLFRSIVPLLTKPPIWTSTRLPTRQSTTIPTTEASGNLRLIENSSGSRALRGKVLFCCAILDCIGSFVQCLGVEVHGVAIELLPLVLECSASGETMEIKSSASSLLDTLAREGCGLVSPSAFVVQHIETTLIPSFRSKIRATGGVSITRDSIDIDGLCRMVASATKMLEIATPLIDDDTTTSRRMLPHLRAIVSDFSTRFDYLTSKDEEDGIVAIQFLRLFRLMVEYIQFARRAMLDHVGNQETVETEPWFSLLDDFQVNVNRKRQLEEVINGSSVDETNTGAEFTDEIASDTDFVSTISWRCCYLLSHRNLKVQILSSQVLGCCFQFLGWVATLKGLNTEKANAPQTSVLRQVTACWPTLSKKLRSLSSASYQYPSLKDAVLVAPQNSLDVPSGDEDRVFLVSLLELLQQITSVSDDFMASRLREIGVPVAQNLLGKLLAKTNLGYRSDYDTSSHQRTSSGLRLLLATIGFVNSMFRNRATGVRLSGLVPKIASSLLPFLQDEDASVVSATSDAFKTMMLVDGDALYSLLLNTSGVELQPSSWEGAICIPPIRGSRLESPQVKQLLTYLQELPEQPIW